MNKLSRKKLPLYAFAGFGPNLISSILTVYLINALKTEGIDPTNWDAWTFASKTLIVTVTFSILVTIARLIDGITDIPFAAWTDTLKTKWGKRRPAILIGYIPMILTFLLFCIIPFNKEESWFNTFYYGILLMLYFSAYTLTYVTYYGSYSEVTSSADDRVFLSSWKAFFDTIQYSIAYALIPVFLNISINIRMLALILSPLMLTMVIVFFILKEKSTLPQDIAKTKEELENTSSSTPKEEDVSFIESLRLTIKNKGFMLWLCVMALFFFGLQLFLAGQPVLAQGAMGLEGWQIAVMNTSAFAPVPLMLWLYRKVMKKKGFRFAFQTALLSFALAMLTFSVAYVKWIPDNIWYVRLIIGLVGGTIGSYGIGAFFSAPYTIPAQMAAEELAATGKSHPSMYFAIQGFFNAIVAAISTGLVWLNIRDIVVGDEIYFGTHLMPYIVAGSCFFSIIVAFFLPQSFNRLGRHQDVKLTEN